MWNVGVGRVSVQSWSRESECGSWSRLESREGKRKMGGKGEMEKERGSEVNQRRENEMDREENRT